jgi:O-antigen/teichoic acid export membrane protein
MMAERVVRGVVAVFVTAAVARYLGRAEFGVLSYALAFVALFATLWTLGLSGLVVRELVHHPRQRNEILGSLFVMRAAGGLLGTVLIIGSSQLGVIPDGIARPAVAILAVASLFYAFDGIDFWFQSRVQSRYEISARLVALALVSVANVVLILIGAPLLWFVAVAAAEYVLAGIGLVIAYQWVGESIFDWRASWSRITFLLGASWPLILSGVFNAMNLRIDQVMLGAMASNTEVGTYAAAARLSEVWYFVPTAIAASVFPNLLLVRQSDRRRYVRRQQQLYDLMALVSIPMALLITLGSSIIIGLIYGPEFSASAPILAIHIWAGPFVFMAAVLSKWLVAENYLKFSFVRHGGGALVNIGLNLVLIPRLGGMGAAIATLVSYSVASVFACFLYSPTRRAGLQMLIALTAPLRYPSKLMWPNP